MATLVLTAAGSIFGPIGGAVGALIGRSIDGQLRKPKGREGPRLQDLRVQTSSYGVPIPRLFGTMRVAGTVIWSTDLIERRSREGGKGRPTTTTYSYSASFAVLLSSRPIKNVRRIWADGNLLRGAAGDWKQETGFRLHRGDENQDPDPFITSAEGSAAAPAYRGCAYAVFENMALEPYGNRIPSLTFEVDADEGTLSIGRMLSELSDGEIGGSFVDEIGGFAASGDSLIPLIASLDQAYSLRLRDTGERLDVASAEEPATRIVSDDIAEGTARRRRAAVEAPASLAFGYYDPTRDYQIGTQGSGHTGRGRTERIDLPAALNADQARGLAEAALARRMRQRVQLSLSCGWRYALIAPGDLVRLGTESSVWRVERRSVERSGVKLELASEVPASTSASPADPGRGLPVRDAVHGPTTLHLLDLPLLDDNLPSGPRILIAAAGQQPGWRRANLLARLDPGAEWQPIGRTALPSIVGTAETVLPIASPVLFDLRSSLVVVLGHEDMQLQDADDQRLLDGANVAIVGAELIQFGSAIPLGAGRWRLSRLLRGRRGTEWAVDQHAVGDRFLLLEPDTLRAYEPSMSAVGSSLSVLASGIGDPMPVERRVANVGESLRPPSPVHLKAFRRADGSYDIEWIRRSRLGWMWGDMEPPIAEDAERYRIVVRRADGEERSFETAEPRFRYDHPTLSADRMSGGHVDLLVSQIGTSAVSRPAEIRLTL